MTKKSGTMPKNLTPWETSLPQRAKLLMEAERSGKKINLLVYEAADTSTFRYRGYNVQQWTLQSSTWQAVYFFCDEIPYILQWLNKIQILTIIRIKWTHEVDRLIKAAKREGIPVVFDVDDLVFDLEQLPIVTNTLNVGFESEADYSFWFAYIGRLSYTAEQADAFTTTNACLGEKLTAKFAKPYYLVRNTLNCEQLTISKQYAERKETFWGKGARANGTSRFTVGYFSGTPSHINDFRVLEPELVRFLSRYPDAKLEVVGFMEFSPEMQSLIQKRRVVHKPLTDFLRLQEYISQVDLNIVPLVENVFTNCKSELKYFEAGAVKTLTAATPTYTYRQSMDDGVNGFLCPPGAWYHAMKFAYDDPAECRKMEQRAWEHSVETYSGESIVREIEWAYDSLLKDATR